MNARDLTIIAAALDTFVNEYTGAAPEDEIRRANELATGFAILAEAAERKESGLELAPSQEKGLDVG